MKISKLLATRRTLQRQAHLASLAHAYFTLRRLAARTTTVGLRGAVRLQPAEPREERYWPTLTALEGPQSRIEEHFSDQDLMDMADAIALAVESNYDEIEFDIADLAQFFVAPLRFALEQAGVVLDLDDKSERRVTAENADGTE